MSHREGGSGHATKILAPEFAVMEPMRDVGEVQPHVKGVGAAASLVEGMCFRSGREPTTTGLYRNEGETVRPARLQ